MSSQERWPPTPAQTSGASSPRPDSRAPQRAGRDVFEGLTSLRRRRILAILVDGSDPVEVTELARRLAAVEEGCLPTTVSDEATDELLIDLQHVQLPALVEAGLLDRDEGEETVVAADHPAFDDPAFRHLVESRGDVDDVVDTLASERRRLVLAVLQARDEPVGRSALAREVAAYQRNESSPSAVEEVEVTLHHVHLPKLEAVGLVERDAEAETVRYLRHPDVDEAWFAL